MVLVIILPLVKISELVIVWFDESVNTLPDLFNVRFAIEPVPARDWGAEFTKTTLVVVIVPLFANVEPLKFTLPVPEMIELFVRFPCALINKPFRSNVPGELVIEPLQVRSLDINCKVPPPECTILLKATAPEFRVWNPKPLEKVTVPERGTNEPALIQLPFAVIANEEAETSNVLPTPIERFPLTVVAAAKVFVQY